MRSLNAIGVVLKPPLHKCYEYLGNALWCWDLWDGDMYIWLPPRTKKWDGDTSPGHHGRMWDGTRPSPGSRGTVKGGNSATTTYKKWSLSRHDLTLWDGMTPCCLHGLMWDGKKTPQCHVGRYKNPRLHRVGRPKG